MSYTLDGDSLRFRGEGGTQMCALDVPASQDLVLQGTSPSAAGTLAGLAAPVYATDALSSGHFAWKAPVAAVVTSALNATYSAGVLTSVAPELLPVAGAQAGDRLLLTGQATQAHNGIYVVTSVGSAGSSVFSLTRAHDFQSGASVAGSAVVTCETGSNGLFLNINSEEPNWTTDAIAFEQVGGAGSSSLADGAVDLAEMAHGTSGGELLVYGATHADASLNKAPKRLTLGTQGHPLRAGAAGEPEYAALDASGIADGSVQGSHIASLAVETAKLADGAVAESNLEGGIATAGLALFAVNTTNLANGAITLADNFVTTAMLADGAVGTAQITNGQVARTDLGNGQVTTLVLADECVSSGILASNAVSTNKFADSSVDGTCISTTLYTTGWQFIGASATWTLNFSVANQIRVTAGGLTRLNVFNTGASTTGTWEAVSDRKWKNLDGPVHNNPLQALDSVDGVQWTWKANGTHGAGVVAQDFASACPQAVTYDADLDGYVVNYYAVVGFGICCAKALKQQTVQVKSVLDGLLTVAYTSDLEEELALQAELAALDARVTAALTRARNP